jgi:hypothetical protein
VWGGGGGGREFFWGCTRGPTAGGARPKQIPFYLFFIFEHAQPSSPPSRHPHPSYVRSFFSTRIRSLWFLTTLISVLFIFSTKSKVFVSRLCDLLRLGDSSESEKSIKLLWISGHSNSLNLLALSTIPNRRRRARVFFFGLKPSGRCLETLLFIVARRIGGGRGGSQLLRLVRHHCRQIRRRTWWRFLVPQRWRIHW